MPAPRLLRVIWAASFLLLAPACGDDDGGRGGAAGMMGGAGTSAGGGGDDGAAGSDGPGADGGVLGPTSSIRIVNLVPDVTFDAWGPDLESRPVRVGEGFRYATASEYFYAPVNRITMEPIFVLWKSGEVPMEGSLFSMLQDDSHERVRIEVRELEAPGERATVIVEPQEPFDEDPSAHLQYSLLDETELERGDASMLNLHVSYHLFGIGDGIVDAWGIVGEPCLQDGSTNVGLAHSVPAGESTLGVFDTRTAAECDELEPLATLPIQGEPGDNLLVVIYREGNEVKMFSAPLE